MRRRKGGTAEKDAGSDETQVVVNGDKQRDSRNRRVAVAWIPYLALAALAFLVVGAYSYLRSPKRIGRAEVTHEVHVITMDPDSKRYQEFKARNGHLLPYLHQWDGIDGRRISSEDAVKAEIITEGLARHPDMTPGTVGVAVSQTRIWRHIADSKEIDDDAVLVVEDDVITHEQILEYAERHASELADADITLCAQNQDVISLTIDKRGLTKVIRRDPMYPNTTWIEEALSKTDINFVESEKLLNAYGLSCYWISPKAAKVLTEVPVLPLSLDRVFAANNPETKHGWPPVEKPLLKHFIYLRQVVQFSLDARLNFFYEYIDAQLLSPALAYTSNTLSGSSTRKILPGNIEKSNYTLEELEDMLQGGGTKPSSLESL